VAELIAAQAEALELHPNRHFGNNYEAWKGYARQLGTFKPHSKQRPGKSH